VTSALSRLLLVEDSSLIADALRVLLEQHGYAVTVADSLAAARAAATLQPPDIVLLDLSLPDGDGLDLARELRQSGRIIALTGHADDATRQRCIEAGCNDVLVKPVSSSELVRRLRQVG
jgi:DNA-binding response OmpR family regulator